LIDHDTPSDGDVQLRRGLTRDTVRNDRVDLFRAGEQHRRRCAVESHGRSRIQPGSVNGHNLSGSDWSRAPTCAIHYCMAALYASGAWTHHQRRLVHSFEIRSMHLRELVKIVIIPAIVRSAGDEPR